MRSPGYQLGVVCIAVMAFANVALSALTVADLLLTMDRQLGDSLNAKDLYPFVAAKLRHMLDDQHPDERYVKIVDTFKTVLETVLENEQSKCSEQVYQQLVKLDQVTYGRSHTRLALVSSRTGPTEIIMRTVNDKIAHHCLDGPIIAEFETVRASMDVSVLDRVAKTIKAIMSVDKAPGDSDSPGHIYYRGFSMSIQPTADMSRAVLDALAPTDLDMALVNNKSTDIEDRRSKLTEFFDRYLADSCSKYRQAFSSIFSRADYYFEMFEMSEQREVIGKQHEFFAAWGRYELCEQIGDAKLRARLVEHILE